MRAAGDARLGRGDGLRRSVDLGDILFRIAAFFRDESCGQCVPCRVGTVRQEELLQRLAGPVSGKPAPLGSVATELELLSDIGHVTRDASHLRPQTAFGAWSTWVDGVSVRVPEGATLLDACRAQGIDTPTLCYLE